MAIPGYFKMHIAWIIYLLFLICRYPFIINLSMSFTSTEFEEEPLKNIKTSATCNQTRVMH